jgi:hypothetical protein
MVEEVLAEKSFKADDDVYLYKTIEMEMVCLYDDLGRLIGEDV